MSKGARSIALFFILVLTLMLIPFNHASLSEQTKLLHKRYSTSDDLPRYRQLADPEDQKFVIREMGGEATCAASTPQDVDLFNLQEHDLKLKQISHVGDGITTQATGLTIVLRATDQLNANATAKAAFTAAAARWEALIQNPITVIIDVDFGPTRFGVPYPGNDVLGATSVQGIGNTLNYPDVRSRLITHASGTDETALYNALPSVTVGTDIGPTAGIVAPTALFRALGSLSAVADPPNEASLGLPPRIGFNSAFAFDFDPSNGIDSDKTDFDAVAVHEIGHALGFSSNTGSRELHPTDPVFLGVLDLFRFRPGMSLGTFPTAQRILSSGGSQIFFAGGTELALSTGRPDGTGGDQSQSSHWKDDILTGSLIGIMDPTIGHGVRHTITSNDVLAFDAFGYTMMGSAPPPVDDSVALVSGTTQTGSVSAPDDPDSGVLGGTQYSIQVPAGTTQLKIDLNGGAQDVDLYARFGAKIAIDDDGAIILDHFSDSLTGVESITISPSTIPALRVGTYYIAVANFGPGAATYSLTATVTTGGGGPAGSPPSISNLVGSLSGDVLTLTGTATDPDGDIVQAQSTLINGAGQTVTPIAQQAVAFAGATSVNFSIRFGGVNAFPSALKVALVFVDSHGNRSPTVMSDFSQADSGGPTIKNATLSGSKMTIKGTRLSGALIVEVNGVDVTTVDVSSDTKAKIKGVASSLHAGDNRLRVRHGTLKSNIFVLTQ